MPEVDETLFNQARQGDRDAFWQLVLPCRGLIYSVARAMLKNHEQAEDQLHDIILIAHKSLSNLRDPQRLPSWLYSMTRNHILDLMRREKRMRKAMQGAAPMLARIIPLGEAEEKELWLTRMEECVELLPEPFREILAMKYTNKYSCRHIAEIMEISVPAVKSRLFEARKLLRKKIETRAAKDEETAMDEKGTQS